MYQGKDGIIMECDNRDENTLVKVRMMDDDW